MLTSVSTVSSAIIYKTTEDDFYPTSSGRCDEDVDETIKISIRIKDVPTVRIPPLTEKQLAQAGWVVPLD